MTFNKKSLSIQKSKKRKPIMRRKSNLETDPELTRAKTMEQLQLCFKCSVNRDMENIFLKKKKKKLTYRIENYNM